MKGIATHPLARQFTKPALDQMQPTGTGGHKAGYQTCVTPEPSARLGVLVSAVVIQHQMQGHRAGKFLVQATQKSQELLMPVALKALPYDPTLEHLESREQRGGAMAFMHLLQSGVPLVMVKGFLGHVDLKSTDVYVQADLEMKRKALDLADGPHATQAPPPRLSSTLIEWLAAL